MTKIENENQYRWALNRVEEILPFVKDDTPLDDPYSIELDLLSGLVADYSDEHYSIGDPTLVDMLKLRMYEITSSRSQNSSGSPLRESANTLVVKRSPLFAKPGSSAANSTSTLPLS